jgi:hypothetical protein
MHIRSRIAVACLLASVVTMLNGCALLFTSGEKVIGVIPREPGSSVVFRTVLPRTANRIWFHCVSPASSFGGEDRVMITLTNTSGQRAISLQNSGAFATVAPHSSARLYDGSLAALLGGRGFWISTWDGRASCELHIQFSPAPTLTEPIRVLYSYSSPPL